MMSMKVEFVNVAEIDVSVFETKLLFKIIPSIVTSTRSLVNWGSTENSLPLIN